jgi:stage V sporulation protein K
MKYGEKFYNNGNLQFEGLTENDKPNGFGKYYYETGLLMYEGEWLNGVYHGRGTLYNEQGKVVYSGIWSFGKPQDGNLNFTSEQLPSKTNLGLYLEELNQLIGLMEVKKEVSSLINFIKIQSIREQRGFRIPEMSNHLVFTGNPGTGKTTIARLISKIYFELGFLSKGHLIETDRAGLVGRYLGETAIKTTEVVHNARGGILFIDEAYSLTQDNSDSYGSEAIDTLIKLMEDYRKDLIIIVAGYPDLMKDFLSSNPGMRSRFNKYLHFEDYTATELIKILDQLCTKYSYMLEEELYSEIVSYINRHLDTKDNNFGNARWIRNLFEKMIAYQANRISNIENYSDLDLQLIKKIDFNRIIK